jgi:MFS family permease
VTQESEGSNLKFTLWALLALNFFMADMQAGIGPFLGIFLQAHGWKSGLIGTVMTLGGVAGMLMTAPAGALIDATKRKRLYVVIPGVCTVAASALILYSQRFWLVAISQVATAIAGSAIGPAVTGITLGLVLQKGFNRQNGHNQASNHAGNVAGAALSGYLGYRFGFSAVFLLAAVFGIASIISVLLIPSSRIDDRAARGMKEIKGGENDNAKRDEASGLSVLFRCKPLLILAVALALFHLGNGAMLPLYGLAVVSKMREGSSGTGFVAMTIIVAQAVMVIMSIIGMRVSEKKGYWLVILISFLSLPIRGLVAAKFITTWGVYPVQLLDGVGAGLQSVAVPGLVARLLNGTGRVNVGQGAVMTFQGVGASLSPLIGGWLAQSLGYPVTFSILGGFALGSIAMWILFSPLLKSACDGTDSRKLMACS